MPIPKPNKGESQKNYISRAIAFQKKETPSMSTSQAAAIAHDIWNKEKGLSMSDSQIIEEIKKTLREMN